MLRDAICAHLPHAGSMCLLDRLERWDEHSITCLATSHRDPANPLRAEGRLHAVCGVEYAAQAMALHGSLLSVPDTTAMDGGSAGNAGAVFRPPAIGYLASVRDLKLDIEDLSAVSEELRITAERLSGDASGFIYEFQIHAGNRRLLSGRAAAKLMAGGG
jgi:predicted hotdog family 3-hydroxylacyl-ACP dehydratase